jgi:hypothetical protein
MKLRILLTVLAIALIKPVLTMAQPIRVLVVTGGHDYNRSAFEGMLDSLPGEISYKIAEFPDAFVQFDKQHRDDYDVIVFYHMWQVISPVQQKELTECIRKGKPLVVLHHSICAFDNWDEYINLIGGKYFHRSDTVNGQVLPPSSYKHDVNIAIHVKDKTHPVTAGIADFSILDETYDNFYVQPEVTTLLSTDTPGSTKIIGWTKNYGRARVVTLQSGHDVPAYRSPEYRSLLSQAIRWVSGL